jgi:hypothetical protein
VDRSGDGAGVGVEKTNEVMAKRWHDFDGLRGVTFFAVQLNPLRGTTVSSI